MVLRLPLPQTLEGLYFRQKVGKRLLLGARLMRFSNDLAVLRNTPGLVTQSNYLKSATTLSLDSLYTFAGQFKWYSEATWSTSEQDSSVAGGRRVPVSTLVGPILDTSFVRLRANYAYQSDSYFPLLGYYLGDRQGPFGEVTFHSRPARYLRQRQRVPE